MLLVQCNSCNKVAFTEVGYNPDAALDCDCCPDNHNHGTNANETGVPCRPVTITAMPGSSPMQITG